MNNNCYPEYCPRGHRVIDYCNETLKTVSCETCPPGTFASRKNNKRDCQRCQICRRKEIIKSHCNSTSNTKCRCRSGYIYDPPKPCFKPKPCPKGTILKNNHCINATNIISTGNKTTFTRSKDTNHLAIGLTLGLLILLVVIIIVIFCIVYRRRSRRYHSHENGGNTPDVLKNIKTPPLPPKMLSRRSENQYEPAPQAISQARPLIEKKLSSFQLPFSLVHDMNIMLSAGHSKNYKHLAGKLGYSYVFVKSLETKSQPLETLLDHYISSENPTKERLYEALLAIDRPDVAQMVWDEL